MVIGKAKKGVVLLMMTIGLFGVIGQAVAGSGQATIKAGHPGTVQGGVTELAFLSACKGLTTVPADLQGVDAYVIDVSGNTRFSVTGTPNIAGPFSMNVVFYSGAKCDYMSTPSRALVGSSYGPIDITGARYAVVSLAYGADVRIDWNAWVPA